ncbi:MAG: hypothetical protein ABSA91_02080, partial [Acidimicrobiales bacterium]
MGPMVAPRRHPSAQQVGPTPRGLERRYHRLTLNRHSSTAVVGIALALVAAGVTSGGRGPTGDPGVVGLVLTGAGATLVPPSAPASQAYTPQCHRLIDAGFAGKCVVASSAAGTVVGIVEEETATTLTNSATPGSANSAGVQERDLVWRRKADRWVLALRRLFPANTGLPSLLWADDVARNGDVDLVFLTPTDRAGFGNELDLIAGSGRVSLYRYLGQGFADVPAAGGVVTYVPGWTEQNGPFSAYDQVLIGYSGGSWRV